MSAFHWRAGALGAALLGLAACAAPPSPPSTAPPVPPPPPSQALTPASLAPPTLVATGKASWYGVKHKGRSTASGDRFDPGKLTAAHATLPFGSYALVTNLDNGRSVVVVINDRGPHGRGRIIDLSPAAAQAIGLHISGVAPVRVESPPPAGRTPPPS